MNNYTEFAKNLYNDVKDIDTNTFEGRCEIRNTLESFYNNLPDDIKRELEHESNRRALLEEKLRDY